MGSTSVTLPAEAQPGANTPPRPLPAGPEPGANPPPGLLGPLVETTAMDGEGRARSRRAREAFAMLRGEIGLHPRPFVVAVTGAAVFALGTVASSVAIRWV